MVHFAVTFGSGLLEPIIELVHKSPKVGPSKFRFIKNARKMNATKITSELHMSHQEKLPKYKLTIGVSTVAPFLSPIIFQNPIPSCEIKGLS